jgi:Family of unknown function (DUF5995)
MAANPPSVPPATTVAEVITGMQSIDAALPADDGVACFNRMYLQVTEAVNKEIQQGTFADPEFLSHLDVVFANLYFAAVNSLSASPPSMPPGWQPLLVDRSASGIEPIQFALAGMNTHINNDLPLAVVATCNDLGTAPTDGSHYADYQKVDALLDASEQAIRESFEPSDLQVVDRHVAAVLNLVANWSIRAARDVAWDNALGLWEVRDRPLATRLLTDSLARTVGMASRVLLAVV